MGFPKYLKNLHIDVINYYQNQERIPGFENSKFWKRFGKRDYQYMWNYQLYLLAKYSQNKNLTDITSLHNSIQIKNPYLIQKECFRIVLKCLYKCYDKKFQKNHNERINFKWFVSIDDSKDKAVVKYIWIKIDPLKYEIISLLNSRREEEALRINEEREKIKKIKNTTYLRRTFPPKLRMFIFQRDNFQCQYCGISQSDCMATDINLEVHHIKEWEDGGETNFENGITCCSKCNKGLHHTKKLNLGILRKNITPIFFPFVAIMHYIMHL